jgi:anti-anti-sigma factor
MGRLVAVASPVGELDIGSVDEVDRIFQGVEPRDHMIIDLGQVPFVDSVTLSRFVRVARRHEAAGSRVVLAAARGPVRRVLAITQLDAVLPYADDVETARALLDSLDQE